LLVVIRLLLYQSLYCYQYHSTNMTEGIERYNGEVCTDKLQMDG